MATDSEINKIYREVLGRDAKQSGIDYFMGDIAKGQSLSDIRNSIANSAEAKSRASSSRSSSSSGSRSSSKSGSSVFSGITSSRPSSSSSSGSSNNVASAINDLYQKNLGRSVDRAGLDYWSKEANQYGLDYVERAIRSNNEYNLYQNRGVGMTVAKPDQVSGFTYRNINDIATQQARNEADYGLLISGMAAMVQNGNYTPVQDDSGQTLYRSVTGGLYDITGMPVPERPTRIAPQTQVTPQQTSQYQLYQMLDSNSPLMQQAAMMGNQRANARGLLNSSMASQAAQAAMIDRATPFAQQDAQTYFQNSQANADRLQQEYMANLNYQNQRGLNEQQYGFQRGLNEQGYGFDMGRMQQQFNNEMQRMGYAYELDQRNVPQNYAANISAQTLQNVQAIQADPNLEPAAKQAAIKNAIDMANANLTWAEVFYNTPMPALRIPGAA